MTTAQWRLAAWWRTTVALVVWVVNADNYRGPAVATELRALHAYYEADIIGVVEAVGNRLPHLPGMACVVGQIRSRDNIAVYVRASLLRGGRIRPRWHDMEKTWPRTEGPGQHPARSFLVFRVWLLQVVVAHIPPAVPGAGPAREECIEAIVRVMAPWTRPGWKRLRQVQRFVQRRRPRLLLVDANGADEILARLADLEVTGVRVDTVLGGGDVEFGPHHYVEAFAPPPGARGQVVPFRGDHKHVLRATAHVPSRYLSPDRLSEVPI